ncbi:MAG: hypothetical protein GF350_01880 [Chitinivibrionales bacterium]|nr:hypothetical protein [Chitinivibrionales bacterium]
MKDRYFGNALLYLIIISLAPCVLAAEQVSIAVDADDEIAPLQRMWRCTGHASGHYEAHSREFRLNTMYIGGIPHNSIEFMRLHNLLYTIEVDTTGPSAPVYDWSGLDAVFDQITENGMRPNFELMGGPRGMKNWGQLDFVNSEKDRDTWKNFIWALVEHCVERYGIEEVRGWMFETENEPYPKTDEGFKNLVIKFQADEAAIHAVDSALMYGGPGRAGSDGDGFIQYLLRWCHDSVNVFSGDTGTRIDFVEWHSKGPYWLAVEDAKNKIDFINQDCPDFKDNILLVDDESDPVAGHGMPLAWKIGPSYAAMVACRIWACQTKVAEDYGGRYQLMNQDNAFIHGWPGRSMLCRFRSADENHFAYIKKTSILTYEMLSLLGDTHIRTTGYDSPPFPTSNNKDDPDNTGRVEALATRDPDGRVAVLILNNREYYIESTPDDAAIDLTFNNLPFSEAMLVRYQIDEHHSNAFRVWQKMGGPVDDLSGEIYTHIWDKEYYETVVSMQGPEIPDAGQLAALRDSMELQTAVPPAEAAISGGAFTMQFDLPCPGISLVILAPRPASGPGPVSNVWIEDNSGPSLTGERETVIRWNETSSKYIKTYKVLYSETENGDYQCVNNADFFSTTFIHNSPSGSPEGYYKIQAVDYWDRTGPAVAVGEDVFSGKRFLAGTAAQSGIAILRKGKTIHCRNRSYHKATITLFDPQGRLLLQDNIPSKDALAIDTRAKMLFSGIFYLKTSQNNRLHVQKIIIF